MTHFRIDIVSDTVCPWCYIGKKKLESAIAQYKQRHPEANDTFSTTWKPYYLNPDSPMNGMDKQELYKSKFGEQRAVQIFERVKQAAADVGIKMSFGGRTGNTRNSHRLIQLGSTKSPEMQTRVVEELFTDYFEKEQDITSLEVLRKAGIRAGLDEKEVDEWLKSDKGGKEVDEEVREARMNHISGVPNFTINERYEVGGAQDPQVFLSLFEKIKGRETL